MPATVAQAMVNRSGPEPLRDQIHQKCRQMIMSGHVVPGQKLPLRPMAEEFNTSLMPVRDALNRLVADGALELSASRTIRVPAMSDEQLVELHEVRRSLEGFAGECAALSLPDASIRRLEQLIASMAEALAVDDYDTYVRDHYSFHFTIYAAANRPILLKMIDVVWLRIGPWFRQGVERANHKIENPNVQHELIVAALRARDTTAVRQHIEQDVFSSMARPGFISAL